MVRGAPWGFTGACIYDTVWMGVQSQEEQTREVIQPLFSLAYASTVWLQAVCVKEKLLLQLQP